MKIFCQKCNIKIATWYYMPNGKYYYCDNCVSRGCSCNEDDDGNQLKDEFGRSYPCVEYDYDENGFDEE